MIFYKKDYQKPSFELPETKLKFYLHPTSTIVESELSFKNTDIKKEIFLNGIDLKLISINLKQYILKENGLSFMPPEKDFTLKISVEINPSANTALTGLYLSNGLLTTQNEPEGFRHITYYPDHPDVMSKYTCTIVANSKEFPVRLSNGNIIFENSEAITFQDPFPKPSYLFALVAGKLDVLKDTYKTKSGKNVTLNLYCEKGKKDRLSFAMDSLKRAMLWDENVFDLEYDLNQFSIVAVSHFNFGAMENKSLNIFNDSLLLATPMTATDWTYEAIDDCIAHEYFHNYSGDRVTLQNWFNLSLKESLTVYRDKEYTYDTYGRDWGRIETINLLKRIQYPEDDGPLAHPIMLTQAESVDNFYTSTIYNKGAEVIRMIREIVGFEKFMEGCKLYFKRHDGQAVTIEDFICAIEDASGTDLSQFMLWYQVPGRPKVHVETHYKNNTFTVTISQTHSRTTKPFIIPLAYGLVGKDGKDLLSGTLVLDEKEKTWVFDVIEEPILSINRHFSAFIDLDIDYTLEQREHLMRFDSDLFNRYHVVHQYMLETMLKMLQSDQPVSDDTLMKIMGANLQADIDNMLKSWMITLPTDAEIINASKQIDVEQLQSIRHLIRQHFADTYQDDIFELYKKIKDIGNYRPLSNDIAQRSLKNILLSYLALTNKNDTGWEQYKNADNFTDLINSLSTLVHYQHPKAKEALKDFYQRYQNDPIPFQRWFMIQASAPIAETVGVVKQLMNHEKFDLKNPNIVRALLGVFTNNTIAFHSKAGYDLIVDAIKQLDPINPHIASSILGSFITYHKMPTELQQYAIKKLTHLSENKNLSEPTKEILKKLLQK